jgi:hypothetical protein
LSTTLGDLKTDINTTGNVSIGGAGATNQTALFNVGTSPGQGLLCGGANGNVGVGTTNPTNKFQITQSANTLFDGIRIANTGTTSSLRFWVDGSNTARIDSSTSYLSINKIYNTRTGVGGDPTAVFSIRSSTVAGGAGSFAFRIQDSTPTDRLVVTDAGNMGIGLTNPTTQLQMTGNLTFQNTLLANGVGNGGVSELVTGNKNTTGESYQVYNSTISTSTVTLADGKIGQRVSFVAKKWSDTGTLTITPTTALGFTSLQLDTVADSCTFEWTSAGWIIVNNQGGTVIGS